MSRPSGAAAWPAPLAAAFPVAFLVLLLAQGGARADVGDDDQSAVDAVHRAAAAASSLAWSGTELVSTWSAAGTTTRLADVEQRADGTRTERVRSAGAQASLVTATALDPTTPVALEVLAQSYRLRTAGPDAVDGRPAARVEALRDGRVAARLWVDEDTGLLLRQEILDADGRVTRMTVLLDLDLTPTMAWVTRVASFSARPALALGPRTDRGADTWSLDAARSLDPQVWPCPHTLPGGLRLVDARWTPVSAAAGSDSALHLTYTDGLSGLSVFVQDGEVDLDALTGWTPARWDGVPVAVGTAWPTRVVWQGGDHVFTVVSDTALDDVRSAVGALPHGPADDGFGAGVAGLARDVLGLFSG